jgi:hypothetical protein
VDPTVPNVARMYDYMLGGSNNYDCDRAAVAKLIEVTRPALRQLDVYPVSPGVEPGHGRRRIRG